MNENRQQPNRDEQHPGDPVQWEATPPAGTTQHVKHGDVLSIEITLRQAEALVDAFGGHDALISVIERPDAWPNMDLGLYAYCTDYPDEGAFYLGPTEVDDDLAANGRSAATPVKTWRERLGRPADFPLHAPPDVERAMEAEIAELRGQQAAAPIAAVCRNCAGFGWEPTISGERRVCGSCSRGNPNQRVHDYEAGVHQGVAEERTAAAARGVQVLTIPLAIMDIAPEQSRSDEYKLGHRDARHAAADLVLERADELVALTAASTVPATAEMLDTLGRIDPFTMSQQEGRSQWFERLSRARVTQQPLCVPGGAVVIWRMDLAWAVAELLQLRAYRDLIRAKDDRRAVAASTTDSSKQTGEDPDEIIGHNGYGGPIMRKCTCPSGDGSLRWPCPQHPPGDMQEGGAA